MKKFLLAKVLIAGCNRFASSDNTHEGVCTRRWDYPQSSSMEKRCFPNWTEKECLNEEESRAGSVGISVAWYYMTCEEFCALPGYYDCSISAGER